MSDYGFVTYDPKSPKRRIGIVNSKWPIFGPRYDQIKTCYKTYHFSDTTSQVAKNVSWGVGNPTSNNSSKSAYRYQQVEVFRVKHGFKKRPVGYIMFSGNVVKNVRCYIKYAPTGGTAVELTGVNSGTIPIVSSLQDQMSTAYTSTGYNPTMVTLENSVFTIYDGSTYFPTGDLLIPSSWPSVLKTSYYMYDGNDPDIIPVPGAGIRPPFEAVIDDEDVILYRNIYSCEIVWRYDDYPSTVAYYTIKGIDDTAGSQIDMTLFLCPYNMEDLL